MEIITEDQMKQQIEAYLAEHKDEIDEKVQKKIGVAINQSIVSAFDNSYGHEGFARKMVRLAIENQLTEYIKVGDAIDISMSEMREKVQAQVTRAIKKVHITFG